MTAIELAGLPGTDVSALRDLDWAGTRLRVRDLNVAFTPDGVRRDVVRGVSFDLDAGACVAIVGESGSGKSVTARSLVGLAGRGSIVEAAELQLHGEDVAGFGPRDWRRVRGRDVGFILQDALVSLDPLRPVGAEIAESLRLHGWTERAARERKVLELLESVGVPNPRLRARQRPDQLSGGLRQRALIASAIAVDPDVVIADEPTTALDVTVQAQILELLSDLKTKHGMSMLFITHDLGIVRKFADRVCVMTKGKIVETGTVEQVFNDPQHAYTRHLLAAEPKGEPPHSDASKPVVMQGDDIKVWFPIKAGLMRRVVDHVKAVDGIDITLRAGQTVGVVGESGSGKTTLGLALSRLIASKGRISFIGQSIDHYSYEMMKPLRNRLQVVFQDPYGSLSPRMSVGEI
ncbi:MAG TPA: ATP-binding cassette domain-containing protein, partial [Pseudolysinimonas sp.]